MKEAPLNLITMKKSVFILTLLLSFNIYGQKKVLDHSDFDIWNRIQNSTIDSKGEYIMYSVEKGEKDSHLKIKDLSSNLIFDYEWDLGCGYACDSQCDRVYDADCGHA